MMRTTVTLPDDIYEMARAHAHARRISLGDALAELVRRGEPRPPLGIRYENGFPVFDTPPGAPKITLEDVQRAQESLDEEDARRAWEPNS